MLRNTKKGRLARSHQWSVTLAALAGAAVAGTAGAAVLTWTGATNNRWDDATADVNWVDSSSTASTYTDGSQVVFTDTGGGLNSGASSSEYVITIYPSTTGGSTTGVAPASVNFNDNGGGTSGSYAFTNGAGATAGINGSTSLTLNSGFTGTVYLNSANTYSGGTYINGGTLHGGTGSFSSTNTFYLGGGTMQTASGSGGTYAAGQNFVATAGTTSSIQATSASNNVVINGAISSSSGATASGTVLTLLGGETVSSSALNNFTGTINMGSFGGGTLRLDYASTNGTGGSSNAIFDLGSSTSTLESYNGGGAGGTAFANAIPLGALEGAGTGSFLAGAAHTGSSFFAIGGLGLTTTFNGTVKNASQPLGLYIVGGALTLTGNNSYTLGTTVQTGGTLFANNATSSTGTGGVIVAGSQTSGHGTFGGSGTVTNGTTVNTTTAGIASFLEGAHLAPGVAGTAGPVATLTLTGGLTLNDYTNLDYTLNGASALAGNDLISTNNGALTVSANGLVQVNLLFTNGAPVSGSVYDLINYGSGTLTAVGGGAADVSGWTATGLPDGETATFSAPGNGQIDVSFAVPEPGSMALIGLVSAATLLRRKRARNA